MSSSARTTWLATTYTNESPEAHATLAPEAVEVAGIAGGLLLALTGEIVLHLGLELGVTDGEITELAQVDASLVNVAALDVVPGRLGAESSADEDESTPDELEGDGETPRDGSLTVVHAVVDNVGEEDAEGGAELVSRSDHAAEVLGRALEIAVRGWSSAAAPDDLE